MAAAEHRTPAFDGWRGMVLVAATYIYFLIFAQFGFLQRLTDAGIGAAALKPILAAMAAGGIAASLAAGRMGQRSAGRRLPMALLGCAIAAGLTLVPLNRAGAAAISLLIGISLGTLTVTLVSNLRLWAGARRPLLWVGLGTGLGYWICNFPALFTALPQHIAMAAMAACLAALPAAASGRADAAPESPASATEIDRSKPVAFGLVLAWFTALVWLDSAAFFIIQNSPALKAGTWQGAAHLWRTGAVHLVAAIACVWLLARRGTATALLAAFGCLAGACLLLLNPAHGSAAAFLYPAGVSLYSVALVAYPSLLLGGVTAEQRSRRAGWIYAVAGWMGSAMGIGMAQHLHRIPVWFVAAAAVLFLVPMVVRYGRTYWREAVALVLVLATSWGVEHLLAGHAKPASLTAVERGRQVYISEGCINCHSQYVRPGSPDVQMWGPAGNLEAIRHEHPPLIGNRREGPDLTNVGARRSRLWLRIHLIDPRAVSYGSIMPSYAYLFRDQRGDDLVAYLASLKNPGALRHVLHEAATWEPARSAAGEAAHIDGAKLYTEFCATCHSPRGEVRQRWGGDFRHRPPRLDSATLNKMAEGKTPAELKLHLERIIKFGVPKTSMPGHEYFPDAQIAALANYLMSRDHASATN